ncbi:MAG: amidophosphoribosyltransferase [Firmicutes bacterium]|nr:amidophosphoribosyltransferase [Bacillota bacterium]
MKPQRKLPPFLDKPHEECGVLGIYEKEGNDVAKSLYYGLFALQHRGQASAGIAVNNNAEIRQIKDKGLVGEIFNVENLASLKGNIGVGHVRYAKEADEPRENAQPIVTRYCKGSLTLAHNGNILNSSALKDELLAKGAVFQSTSEIEVIMHLLAVARIHSHSVENAVKKVMTQIEGAYSMVIMSPRKLLAVRDPKGFRPLCIGKTQGGGYAISSESAGLDAMNAEFVRDVEPGEIVVIEQDKLTSHKDFCGKKPSLCIFEYIYFARPDSIIDGVGVYNTRIEIGKSLARAYPVDADIVIGVPDSGLNFAHGFSEESRIPFGDGLVRNRYTGRTFIRQTQAERDLAVNLKLNALRPNLEGKRVVLIDDSIVRGTTTANLIRLLKRNGAKEVHIRIGSPPFMWPCHFGTDIPDKKHLFAVKYPQEKMCAQLGADSLGFLSADEIKNIGLRNNFGYCDACFSGKYPVKV